MSFALPDVIPLGVFQKSYEYEVLGHLHGFHWDWKQNVHDIQSKLNKQCRFMFQMRKLFNVIAFRQMYDSLAYPHFKSAWKDLFDQFKPWYTTKNVSYTV